LCTICWSPHETSLLSISRRTQAGRVCRPLRSKATRRAFFVTNTCPSVQYPKSRQFERHSGWSHPSLVSTLFLSFGPSSLRRLSCNLTPSLRSEGFGPHLRSLLPTLFAALAAHLLHDVRNQSWIHELDCTGHGTILPMNGS
jgi:hypothetical protein